MTQKARFCLKQCKAALAVQLTTKYSKKLRKNTHEKLNESTRFIIFCGIKTENNLDNCSRQNFVAAGSTSTNPCKATILHITLYENSSYQTILNGRGIGEFARNYIIIVVSCVIV